MSETKKDILILEVKSKGIIVQSLRISNLVNYKEKLIFLSDRAFSERVNLKKIEMKNNMEFLIFLRKKAEENHCTLNQQIDADAKWLIENESFY